MVPQPLRGKRVVELGQYIAAPTCGQLLADFGANVVKVEPASGDGSRGVAASIHGSPYTRAYNTGKASRVLELRREEDRVALDAMLAESDALVMDLAPATLEGLGLSWEKLHRRHRRLVVTAVSGYGLQDERTCTDMVAQCESGFAALNADADGTPRLSTSWPTDLLSGLYAGISTAMALLDEKRRTGVLVDVSMMEVAITALLGPAGLVVAEGGVPAAPSGNRDRSSAPSNIYRTSDGWAYISGGLDHHWRRLAPLVRSDPGLGFAARVADASGLDAQIESWSRSQTTGAVLAQMRAFGIPAGAVRTPADAVAAVSAVRLGGAFRRLPSGEAAPSHPVLFSGKRLRRSPAPRLGEGRRLSERFTDEQ